MRRRGIALYRPRDADGQSAILLSLAAFLPFFEFVHWGGALIENDDSAVRLKPEACNFDASGFRGFDGP